MQRSHLLVIAAVVALGVVGYWSFRQADPIPAGSPPDETLITSRSAPGSATGDTPVRDVAAEAAQRNLIAQESSAAPSAPGATVLRLILEEISEDSASMAKVTVATYDKAKQRTARIRESWPSQGTKSEFGLDAYLADVAKQLEDQSFDELKITVEHPHYLREIVRVPATSGVASANGPTVYEVRVRFAKIVFWPELELSVRDAVTKKHLDDVELRCVPTAFMGTWQQPEATDPFTVLGDGLDSPIALRGGRKASESEDYVAGIALRPGAGETPRPADLAQPEETARGVLVYARAPGYAWGRIVLDVSKSAGRELLLGPETTLSVRFANVQLAGYEKLEKPATICVGAVRPDGEVSGVFFRQLDDEVATAGLRVDGLEPGEHTVSVELGHAFTWRKRQVLASERIELVAGQEHEVTLNLADSPEPPTPATLGGVLSFPAFGGEKDVRLWLYKSDYKYGDPDFEFSLADMEPTPGALPSWSFRLEGLPVGRYQARLVPFEKNWIVELPAGGRDDLELVVPALAEVVVETVHAKNGERIPLEALRLFTREQLQDRIHHDWSALRSGQQFEGERGRFRFWAVPGPASIQTFGIPEELNVAHRTQELELVAGLQHVRFELAPGYTIKFDFRVQGATLPRDDGIYFGIAKTVRPIGHDGRVGYLSYWMLEADKPGLYEISFEGIGKDRFRPIPPRRIDVRAGETTEVVVDLERK